MLPNGPLHPFARKMIQHFDNLKTPLQSIHQYPSLKNQEDRFLDAGWLSSKARSLWDLWGDPSFISAFKRAALSDVEPFDEWEEFALFASHYFLLLATKNSTEDGKYFLRATSEVSTEDFDIAKRMAVSEKPDISYCEISGGLGGYRRFGAAVAISKDILIHHGGVGTQRRLNSTQIYKSDNKVTTNLTLPPLAIEPRVCHTMTMLDGNRCLLVGGRTSPDHALSDCWLYKEGIWKRVEDLPTPLYRHSATAVSIGAVNEHILIYGGRSSGGKVVNDWLLWHDSTGWVKIAMAGAIIQPRFGAAMSFTGPRHGILVGGMTEDGTIIREIWKWSISSTDASPSIKLSDDYQVNGLIDNLLAVVCRVGACLTWSSNGLLIIGGLARQLLSQHFDIIQLIPRKLNLLCDELILFETSPITYPLEHQASLLIGHSTSYFEESIVIVGGGSVCFSFGTYWNQGILVLQNSSCRTSPAWTVGANDDYICDQALQDGGAEDSSLTTKLFNRDDKVGRAIPRINVSTPDHFERLMNKSKPFIMENLDLGTCLSKWSLEYLKTKVGTERSVSSLPLGHLSCLLIFQDCGSRGY